MQDVILPVWLSSGIGLTILCAFSWVHFRHLGLAAIAALAPLPGYAAVAFASGIPMNRGSLCYLCAFVAAGALASGMEARICDGAAPGDAAIATIRSRSFPVGMALLLCALAPLFAGFTFESVLSGALVLASGLSAFLLPLVVQFFGFGEDFISGANRLRESRERWLDNLTFTVQPRWGWGVSGIALIFAVLGFFGGAGSTPSPLVLAIATAATMVVAYAVIRDVRRTIAFSLAFSVLMLVTLWASARLARAGIFLSLPEMLLASTLGLMPVLLAAAQISRFARSGDAVNVAILRMFEKSAVAILFICAGVATVELAGLTAVGVFAGILVLCGGVTALVVMPALITGLYDQFPPRVSLDVYRVR